MTASGIRNCFILNSYFCFLLHVVLHCGLQKMDTTARAVMDIITKTTEYLQPNPGDINQLSNFLSTLLL